MAYDGSDHEQIGDQSGRCSNGGERYLHDFCFAFAFAEILNGSCNDSMRKMKDSDVCGVKSDCCCWLYGGEIESVD